MATIAAIVKTSKMVKIVEIAKITIIAKMLNC